MVNGANGAVCRMKGSPGIGRKQTLAN